MFQLDRLSRKPIYEQFVEQFKELVLKDQIDPAEPLPSIRSLSQELSVNPNTLQKAYTLLENEGLCYSVPGSGRYVSKDAKRILSEDRGKQLQQLHQAVEKLALKGVPLEDVLGIVEQSYQKTIKKK